MYTTYISNFGVIDDLAASADAQSTAMTNELDSLRGGLAGNLTEWDGVASEDWRALQQKWNNDAEALNAALVNLKQVVSEAEAAYAALNQPIPLA